MTNTPRIEQAILKLYTAFYNQTLIPESCTHCAVGNICNNTEAWSNFTDIHGSVKLNYVGMVHQKIERKHYGYSPLELLQIEATFLKACGFNLPLRGNYKRPTKLTDDLLFTALEKTISFLCKLDGVTNVFDYSNVIRERILNNSNESVVA
ncbi:Na(+)-translocating NADH-quinone reductase subunit F [Pseudofulvibacter geojedonensis]|uniref:Na(+)-translocating NADH-quinone reductase subunit F n=1 Tax=Pseudofulvibacter geojedonensis TaxID=1123758 RepID=A0ABW3I334_9FLAO